MALRRTTSRLLAALGVLAALIGTAQSARADIIIPGLLVRAVTPAEKQFQAGIAALNKNDLAFAETAFKDSLRLDGKAAAPYMGLAEVALRQGRKDAAEEHMQRAVALAPGNASIQTSWGAYLYSQRELPEAEAALRKAVSLDPRSAAARVYLGDMYLTAFRKPEDAIKEYRAAIEIAPAYAGAHYALGLALLTKGDLGAGETALRQASKLAPQNPLPYHVLGRLYSFQRQYDAALEAFDAALKATPGFPAPYLEKGHIFVAKGDDERALREYKEAEKNDPAGAQGLLNIGMVHQRHQRWAQAEEAYLTVIKRQPRNAVAYNNLAWMFAERKVKLPQALEWAKKAVALESQVPVFHGTLGWVYRAQGDLPKAEQSLRTATSLKPELAAVRYLLARVYAEQGKKTEAVAELKRALASEPNFAEANDARKMLKELGGS
jgi:tetratricopeptide (TPR) repeat protein